MRRAARRDASEKGIVDALEAAGVFVFRLTRPVDLLCFWRDRWFLLECKTPKRHKQTVQSELDQQAFCRAFSIPVVSTPNEALEAVGIVEHRTPQPLTENFPQEIANG